MKVQLKRLVSAAFLIAVCAVTGMTRAADDDRVVKGFCGMTVERPDGKGTATNPLVAGETMKINVFFVNPDWGYTEAGTQSPNVWRFETTSSFGPTDPTSAEYWQQFYWYRPRLGLLVSGRTGTETAYAYADFESPIVACDKNGETAVVDTKKLYSKVTFTYTVRAGDLALPLDLLYNDRKTPVGDGTSKPAGVYGICLYNAQYASDVFRLASRSYDGAVTNIIRNVAGSACCLTETSENLPEGEAAGASGCLRGTDTLTYVRAVDFGSATEEDEAAGVWRYISQGVTEVDHGNATALVTGETVTNNVTVYLWTTNDAVAVLATGSEKWYDRLEWDDAASAPKKVGSNYVATVTLKAGASSATFKVRAVGAVGETCDIFMGSSPTNVFRGGACINATAQPLSSDGTKTLKIAVADPPKPSVKLEFVEAFGSATLNAYGELTTPVTQGDGWNTPVGSLAVIVSNPDTTKDTVLTLDPQLSDVPAKIGGVCGLFATNILRIASENTSGASAKTDLTVTLPKGESGEVARFYVFVRGTTDAAARADGGITFKATLDDASHFGTSLYSTRLVITKLPPVIEAVENVPTESVVKGTVTEYGIEIDDNWRNLNNSNGTYTVTWRRGDTTRDIVYSNLTVSAENILTVPVTNLVVGVHTNMFWVTSPDGKKTAWEGDDLVTTVREKAKITFTVFAQGDGTKSAMTIFPEDDSQLYDAHFALTEPNYDENPLYVFLEPLNADASNKVASALFAYDTNGVANTSTVTIEAAGGAETEINRSSKTITAEKPWIRFLDGDASPIFRVVLCKTATFDPAKVEDSYSCDPVTFTVTNRKPKVTKVQVRGGSGTKYYTDGQTNAMIIVGQERTFVVNLRDEVNADWNATNVNQIVLKWDYYPEGSSEPADTFYTFGGNAASNVYTFTDGNLGAGLHRLVISAMDKDMTSHLIVKDGETWKFSDDVDPEDANNWGATYTLYVPVTDQPQINLALANADYEGAFSENQVERASSGSYSLYPGVYISLTSGIRHDAFEVTLKVERQTGSGDTGFVTFATTNVTFRKDQSQPTLVSGKIVKDADSQAFIRITDMDGSYDATQAPTRYRVTAVPTAACDFQCDDPLEFEIRNVNPTIDEFTASGGYETAAEAKENAVSKNIDITFRWGVDDVRADETNNFKVVVDDSGTTAYKTNDVTRGTFAYAFTAEGAHTVTFTVSDKDGGTATKKLYFYVAPSKSLYVYPHNTGVAGQTTLATTYMTSADGLGYGEVSTDNGVNWTDKSTIQTYSTGDRMANFKARGKDQNGFNSFFYGWMLDSGDESGVMLGVMQLLAPGASYDGSLALPSELGDDEAYDIRQIEVLFSKELKAADNMGDINADGVPDPYAVKVWTSTMTTLYGGDGVTIENAADLKKVSSVNDDADYLPQLTDASGNPSWLCVGDRNKFTAVKEIRGAYTTNDFSGLNFNYKNAQDASLNQTVISDMDLEPNEYAAFTNFAVTASLVPADPADPDFATKLEEAWKTGAWSPENRTDPMVVDTDEDGYPDGWEYYFWYAAHCGTYDTATGTVNARMTGRKFDLQTYLDTETFVTIPADAIEAAFNPTSARGNVATGDETDTDNDGLTDYEEYLLGTNPVDCDSNNDGMPDGWEVAMGYNPNQTIDPNDALDLTKKGNAADNTDGDAMATLDLSGGALLVRKDSEGAVVNAFYIPGVAQEDLETMIADKARIAGTFVDFGAEDTWKDFGFDPAKNKYAAKIPTKFCKTSLDTATDADSYDAFTYEASALPEAFTLFHNQVRIAVGFDPRTAWTPGNGNGYTASRHDPSLNTVDDLGEMGKVQNTAKFTAIDEFRVMRFRHLTGQQAVDMSLALTPLKAWIKYSTIPNVIDVDDDFVTTDNPNAEAAQADVVTKKTMVGAADGEGLVRHGADTNKNGVPDGWELYTGRTAVGTNPTEDPLLDPSYLGADQLSFNYVGDVDNDGLVYRAEFNGTDCCKHYAACATITNTTPQWVNKFWPTDPGPSTWEMNNAIAADLVNAALRDAADTDADGIKDGVEGMAWEGTIYVGRQKFPSAGSDGLVFNFIYGTHTDTGHACIRGGGLNPCTVDTDGDMIPDGWERQFAGLAFGTDGKPVSASSVAGLGVAEVTWSETLDNSLNGDAIRTLNRTDGIGVSSTNTTVKAVYISGGMDGTWPWDASAADRIDDATGTKRDYDFDHDGLQNMQEYLVQSLRHLRYDDIVTQPPETNVVFDAYTVYANGLGGELGYFQTAPRAWDWVNLRTQNDSTQNGLRVMLKPHLYFSETTAITDSMGLPLQASKYLTTDPRRFDSDDDGMDDFYELYHGLNPLLGTEDVIAKSYAGENSVLYIVKDGVPYPYGYLYNAFDYDDWETITEETLTLDFVLYPWLNGLGRADPDGDGLRNENEKIVANLGSPAEYHTDPTPLWMTDSSNTNMSYTARYYNMNEDLTLFNYWAWTSDEVNFFRSGLSGEQDTRWMFSFEENEGYDTDNDGVPDGQEVVKNATNASDPKNFMDPDRRQALYFPGVSEPSAAVSVDSTRRPVVDTGDMFRTFTIECWVKPEVVDREQVILERAVEYLPATAVRRDESKIRANFRLGITAVGKAFGLIDNADAIDSASNQPTSCQKVESQSHLEAGTWTHLTLVYDGAKLQIYVNDRLDGTATTSLIPANGVTDIAQTFALLSADQTMVYDMNPAAFVIGASLASAAQVSATTLEAADLSAPFQGWVDEVRVWDGVRSSTEILDDVKTRYTFDQVNENHASVYEGWVAKKTRAAKTLAPELVYHYNFASLFGAVTSADVFQLPVGFKKNVADEVTKSAAKRTEADMRCLWWNDAPLRSTVYRDTRYVPWIQNTVGHLPAIWGQAPDARYLSENFEGTELASELGQTAFTFPNGANPYSLTHTVTDLWGTFQRLKCLCFQGTTVDETSTFYPYYEMYCFELRGRFQATTDLIPLGGAFAKTTTDFWDADGASDAWEYTGTDADSDNLPDWWETYARSKYAKTLSPFEDLGWYTEVDYNGTKMPAWQAYLRDLAKGMHVENGKVVSGDAAAAYAQTADADGNGLPDWWEKLYWALGTYGADDDPDNDGLSNLQEYLISEVYPAEYDITGAGGTVPCLNPLTAISTDDQVVPDYYLSYGTAFTDVAGHFYLNEYFGEMVTDHDFMEGWWEDQYDVNYTSSQVYDPKADADGDGWSTFGECRYTLFCGSYVADLIDRYLDGELTTLCYPQPAIGITATYYGVQTTSGKGLVVRTSTGNKRVDATFVVNGSETGTTEGQKYIGGFVEGTTLRGFLHPGAIVPGDGLFYKAQMSSDKNYVWNYYWYRDNGYSTGSNTLTGRALNYNSNADFIGIGTYEEYRSQLLKYPHIEIEDTSITWQDFARTVSDADGWHGDILLSASNTTSSVKIGTINYRTGEYEIDLATAEQYDSDVVGCVFRCTYTYRVGQNWPQTVYVSEATTGYVKEGINTIEAFIDLNADGAYDIGEPYGMVQNVDIGWHKVPAIAIELKDDSPVVLRTVVVSTSSSSNGSTSNGSAENATESESAASNGETVTSSLTTKVVVRRTSINGDTTVNGKTVPVRTLVSKTFVNDDRAYLTEADALTSDKPDLDWKWLVKDAAKLGLGVADISSVGYSIETVDTLDDGTTTNTVVKTFAKEFNASRAMAVAKKPTASAPVYSAAPTFTFASSDETVTAFRLQIVDAATNLVYDSGVTRLPARTPYTTDTSAYVWTAPVYAGTYVKNTMSATLADGTNYLWRVQLLNAKYRESDEAADWNAWTPFQMDLANEKRYPKQVTGYGTATAAVRYYGPATNDYSKLVIVEAFENADFTGEPLARMRASTNGLVSVADNTFTNAVLRGIAPGTVYLRAYIDFNDNGVRDDWESWGYANYVGANVKTIYNPKGVTVTADTVGSIVSAKADVTIYIEDTDVNQNEIPDCLEPGMFGSGDGTVGGDDSDKDGIADDDEANYATDSAMWDTDGDGMPDGWEAKFADLDPNFDDAAEVSDGDVMAFARVDATLVTVKNVKNGAETTATYVLPEGETAPSVGDDANGLTLDKTYTYTTITDGVRADELGLGAETTIETVEGETNRVMSVSAGQVVLVHAQVYDYFGYDATTANPAAETQANTKAFTALDKYLLIRYFEALGLCTEENVNVQNLWSSYSLKPYDADNDEDGLPDGWELYVMFGPEGVKSVSLYATPSATPINPWTRADARTGDLDGDTVLAINEYNGGTLPSNPWSKTSLYDYLSANDLLLDGTPAFTDDQVPDRTYVGTNDTTTDSDNDQITDFEEWQAYFLDPTALVDLNAANAWSDAKTPDYFRAAGNSYLGAIYNGGEFIEADYRTRLGMDNDALVWAGTREMEATGWDYWSVARNMQTSKIDFDNLTNAEKLDIVVKYLQIATMSSFTGSSLDDVHQWIEENDDKYGKNVDGYVTKTHGITVDETAAYLMAYLDIDVSTDNMSDVYEYMQTYVDNENRDTIEYPEVAMNLTLKYTGSGSKNVSVLAYQVNPDYTELGEQVVAQWDVNPVFDSGVAQVTVTLGDASSGSIKQGPARFVAYIDANEDGAFTADDTYGESEATIGYLGCNLTITLGEANAGLPAIRLAEGSNTYSTVALVRTGVNGEPLYNQAKGAFIIQLKNNANREALYPSEFVTASYIGIDRNLAKDFADTLESVESVTYEVVRLRADQVADLNVTNLNHYVLVDSNGVESVVDTATHEEVTFNYSRERDEAQSIAVAGTTADDVTFTFTVPTDTVNTKFWLYVVTNGVTECYGDTRGFPLTGLRDGKVVLDAAWFAEKGVSIPTGEIKFGVVLGNDKYGRPDAPTCAFAEVGISKARVYDAQIKVNVRHPTTTFANGITVAAYDSADLANPVAWSDGNASGDVTLKGLRAGAKYYVAAWYVKKADDGRADASVRRPYDTWGYLCNLTVTNASGVALSPVFDAVAVEAAKTAKTTYALYLQDTDWNDNGVADREDWITSKDGTYATSLEPLYGFDINGVEETDLFSDAGEGDVFAYKTLSLPCVATEKGGIVTWYVVWDLAAETTSGKRSDGSIAKGTPISDLKTLRTTYLYDYGRPNASRLALGTNVTVSSAAKVTESVVKEIILVHAQVYAYAGFNPNTANGAIDAAAWVDTKAFTSADKNYVTNYLANVLGVKDAASYALPANYPDADDVAEGRGDGVLDGWELYVMFGPEGIRQVADLRGDTTIHSPWRYADRASDFDGDKLDLLHEYDGGLVPTDPWSAYTLDSAIADVDMYEFHLKYAAGLVDPLKYGYRGDYDNDGLSNFMEFLITRGMTNGYPVVEADKMMTAGAAAGGDQVVPDYYLRPAGMKTYVGEMFADHDKIEDWFEDLMPTEITRGDASLANFSRFVYDADVDADGDGWSNWATARYLLGRVTVPDGVISNAVTGAVTTNYIEKFRYEAEGTGTPTLVPEVNVTLLGNVKAAGRTIVIKAWCENNTADPYMTDIPDAIWTNTVPNDMSVLNMPLTLGRPIASSDTTYGASGGGLREGKAFFTAYVADASAPAEWALGYGFGARGDVRVTYGRTASFSIELKKTDDSILRVDLPSAIDVQNGYAQGSGGSTELAKTSDEMFAEVNECTDRGVVGHTYYPNFAPYFSGTNLNVWTSGVRVRIVRNAMNDRRPYALGESLINGVALTRTFLTDVHPYLTEADILAGGAFDLDWGTLRTIHDRAVKYDSQIGSWKDMTNVSYRIVIDNGTIDSITNNNNLAVCFVNGFEQGEAPTVCSELKLVTAMPRPTFSWRHDNKIGKAYPAFAMTIEGEDGFTWSSGVCQAPARTAEGVYTYAPAVYVGMTDGQGHLFNATNVYTMKVAMLDAKFTDPVYTDKGSLDFTIGGGGSAVGGGLGDYGSIAVAVKYFGPGDVRQMIRVEAYASADFGGDPVAVGHVKNTVTLAATNALQLNATLEGLPFGTLTQTNAYYVLAYLDTNENGERDAWESWGYADYTGTDRLDVYAPRAIALPVKTTATFDMPTCVIYLDDADTNRNGVPDAIEWDGFDVTDRSETADSPYVTGVMTNKSVYGTVVATAIFENLPSGVIDLPYVRMLTQMANGGSLSSLSFGYAMALTGLSVTDLETQSDVTISRFELTGLGTSSPTVDIDLTVDTKTTVKGETLLPDVFGTFSVKLAVTVWHTDTLAKAFTKIGTETVTVGVNALNARLSDADVAKIEAAVRAKIGTTAGFFKITAEPTK